MYLKLGLLTITCLVCLVASTPQYYDEGYSEPYSYGQNPSYDQYDPGYYPQNSGSRVRSVKAEQNQGAPNRKQDKGPKTATGQVHPVNGQAYPQNAGAGLPNGQIHPQGGLGSPNAGARPPAGQGYPINGGGNGYEINNGAAFPNGPTGGSKKPGFESHYSDTQSYSGTSGRVNYQTNVQNNFHYVENTERNVYVIPPSGGSAQKSGNNKNKKDKNRGFSLW